MTVYGEVTYVFHLPQDYDEMKQFEAENDLSIYRKTEDTIAVRYNHKVNATYPYKSKADRKIEPQTSSTPYKVDTSSVCKTEPQTETSTNLEKLQLTNVETMSCAECKHRPIGAEICEEPCHYEPQTERSE